MQDALNLPAPLKPGSLPPKEAPALEPQAAVLQFPVDLAPGEATEAVVRQGGAPADWPGVEELRKTGYFVRSIHRHNVKDDKGREVAAFAVVLMSRP